jgi:glutaminyl-tRNA synthetase
MTYTVLSKRKLLQLVQAGFVKGWDDPRMPTLAGMRRRGFPAEAINDFCDRIGVSTANSVVDVALLEHCVREDLNERTPRVMAVLDPIKVVIDNYPEGQVEWMEAENHPQHTRRWERARSPSLARSISSARTLWRTRRASTTAWPRDARCASRTPT